MTCASGTAPGRLDLLGGVADYSGSLVLEMPTRLATTVVAEPDENFVVGEVVLPVHEITRLAGLPYPEVRSALGGCPAWTHYCLGVAIVLVRHGLIEAPGVRLHVSSEVPQSVGVSSSAALEVATARALAGTTTDPLRLAELCQEAENHVVGAPCGVMDQVAVAVGTPGMVLPILCRPASVLPCLALPPGVEVVGCPTGVSHDVGGGPYRRARVAAFMGKKMVEDAFGLSWPWVSDLPSEAIHALPEALDGASFLERWGHVPDAATEVDPDTSYPVRAATAFGVNEHARAHLALSQLQRGRLEGVGAMMAASHAGYDAMGLGHPAASSAVEDMLGRQGVHGARSSGGGCGGTVVVLCDRGALDDVASLIR
jgi:galactokinase